MHYCIWCDPLLTLGQVFREEMAHPSTMEHMEQAAGGLDPCAFEITAQLLSTRPPELLTKFKITYMVHIQSLPYLSVWWFALEWGWWPRYPKFLILWMAWTKVLWSQRASHQLLQPSASNLPPRFDGSYFTSEIIWGTEREVKGPELTQPSGHESSVASEQEPSPLKTEN